MSVLLKSIDVTLDEIDLAIKQIEDFQKQLEECMAELAQHLVEYGQEVARINLIEMDAVFSGELVENGIHGFYHKDQHCGAIYTDKWYAMYVEFGTGYVGENNPDHPLHKTIGWKHDVHHHGAKGWWYPAPWGLWIPKYGPHKGEKMAWTQGMPSRPFMYNTMRELEMIAEKNGIDFFRIK